jgi:hypothetical protein
MCFAASAIPCQELIWQRQAEGVFPAGNGIGGTVLPLGDVNGDGVGDFVTGFGIRDPNRPYYWLYAGVIVVSGRDRSLLAATPSIPLGDRYLGLTTAGDMDGDGKKDWFARRWDNGGIFPVRVEAVSSATGRQIWQIQGPSQNGYWLQGFADTMLGDLDTDGDGLPDLVTATIGNSHTTMARVEVFDHWGNRRYLIPMGPSSQAVGLGKIGDLDGDGCDDFGYGRYGPNFEGNIVVVSGRTGAEIRTSVGLAPWGNLGYRVIGTGDLDGDGVPDYAGSNLNGNLVMVFSGATGATLYTWTGPGVGSKIAIGGDFDLDGVPDLLIGHAGPVGGNFANPWGPIRAISGRDGSTIWEFYGDVQTGNTEFARTMAWLGPLPGSPYPALVFDEPGYFNFIDWGRIGIVRGSQPGAHLQHDTGCSSSGTVPTNVLRRGPLGLRLAVAKAPPGALALLVVGTSISNHLGVPLPLSLDPIGWPGCRLNVAPEFVAGHLLSTGVHGGYAAHDFAAEPVATGGYRLFAQWLVADATAYAATPVQEFQVR